MDQIPKELSQDQANIMKKILDKQLAVIQSDKLEERRYNHVPQEQHSNAYESAKQAQVLQDEIQILQSKIQNLESKLNNNIEAQNENQQLYYNERQQSQLNSREGVPEVLQREENKYNQKYLKENQQTRQEGRQQFLESLERSFSPSIHSDASKKSKQQSPNVSQSRKNRNKQKNTNRSFSSLKTVDKLKQELAQERSKRIKVQREVDNLQHTLRVKESVVNQYNQLQEQYNGLYLQFERSEKIRLQQKELIAALKDELISLREENENLSQKTTPRIVQQAYNPPKKKKIKKSTKK